DSEVRLAVQSPGEYARGATLKRTLPAETRVAAPRKGPIAELAPELLYLDLERIADPQEVEVEELRRQLGDRPLPGRGHAGLCRQGPFQGRAAGIFARALDRETDLAV